MAVSDDVSNIEVLPDIVALAVSNHSEDEDAMMDVDRPGTMPEKKKQNSVGKISCSASGGLFYEQ